MHPTTYSSICDPLLHAATAKKACHQLLFSPATRLVASIIAPSATKNKTCDAPLDQPHAPNIRGFAPPPVQYWVRLLTAQEGSQPLPPLHWIPYPVTTPCSRPWVGRRAVRLTRKLTPGRPDAGHRHSAYGPLGVLLPTSSATRISVSTCTPGPTVLSSHTAVGAACVQTRASGERRRPLLFCIAITAASLQTSCTLLFTHSLCSFAGTPPHNARIKRSSTPQQAQPLPATSCAHHPQHSLRFGFGPDRNAST